MSPSTPRPIAPDRSADPSLHRSRPAGRSHRIRRLVTLVTVLGAVALGTLAVFGADAGPASASSPPDLKVKMTKVAPPAGFGDIYVAKVTNVGGSTAKDFNVAILNGRLSRSVHISSLAAGHTKIIDVFQTAADYTCGVHVVGWAGPLHTTDDPNRANNTDNILIPCVIF